MPDANPKVFISYSWTSAEHEDFVVRLATRLREDGVDVVLDKWELKEGQDKYKFMERMVADADVGKVVIICDRRYKERADARGGGVGTETQIISPQIYQSAEQTKFIPIARERDENGEAFLPSYLASRVYIDMTSDAQYYNAYDQLVRAIYNQPLNVKPALGIKPKYLDKPRPPSLLPYFEFPVGKSTVPTDNLVERTREAAFLESLAQLLSDMNIIEGPETHIDDQIIEHIANFKTPRDQFIEFILEKVATLKGNLEELDPIHRFFEEAGSTSYRFGNGGYNSSIASDHVRFLCRELFLYTIAIFVDRGQSQAVSKMLSPIYWLNYNGLTEKHYFTTFDHYLRSLDEVRNKRLKLNRISIQIDLVKDRADNPSIGFDDLIQADFLLALRSILHHGTIRKLWFPRSVFFHRNLAPFPIFVKAEEAKYETQISQILDIPSTQYIFQNFPSLSSEHDLTNWRMDYRTIDFMDLMNSKGLTKKES